MGGRRPVLVIFVCETVAVSQAHGWWSLVR